MNVVVVIDGREAIPVRAIPLLTHWASMPPLMVAQVLAKNDGFFFGFEVLQAYLYEDGAVSPIPSAWWKNFCVRDLKALSERLESTNAGRETQHAQWRDESLSLLPQNAFVWKDEYAALHESNWRFRLRQSEYAAWFMNKSNPKNEEVDDAEEPTPMQKIAMRRVNEEFEEWRVLNFSPVIPSTSRKNIVMEGFERQKADTQPQAAPVVADSAPGGTAVVWTTERKKAARAMMNEQRGQGVKAFAAKTAAVFGVTPARLRQVLNDKPKKTPVKKTASHWGI